MTGRGRRGPSPEHKDGQQKFPGGILRPDSTGRARHSKNDLPGYLGSGPARELRRPCAQERTGAGTRGQNSTRARAPGVTKGILDTVVTGAP